MNTGNELIEERDIFLNYVITFLPNTLSDELKASLRLELSQRLGHIESHAVDRFCKKKDICRICIDGGYDCDSDHK